MILVLTSYSVINLFSLKLTSVFGRQKKNHSEMSAWLLLWYVYTCVHNFQEQARTISGFAHHFFTLRCKVFHPWHCWKFGPDNPLLWGISYALFHFALLASTYQIPSLSTGLYLLDSSSTPSLPWYNNKKCLQTLPELPPKWDLVQSLTSTPQYW